MKRNRRFGVPSGGSLKYCAECVNDNHRKWKIKQENLITTKNRNEENDTRMPRTMFSCHTRTYQCPCCRLHNEKIKGRRKMKGCNKDEMVATKLAKDDPLILI